MYKADKYLTIAGKALLQSIAMKLKMVGVISNSGLYCGNMD